MALITCPECGQKVSDQATTCPSCAYPLKQSEIPPPRPIPQGQPLSVNIKRAKGTTVTSGVKAGFGGCMGILLFIIALIVVLGVIAGSS
jgi:zinc-ribbon domain